MAISFVDLRWKVYSFYSEQLLIWGIKKGYIQPYDEELIEKLRDVYYGGIPASILLLSRMLTDGHCYDRALLMSRAFLDDDGDVRLIYAEVADLKYNPVYSEEGRDSDHCFVERITESGKHLIYDTSVGFRYTKWIYWLMNFPKIRHINEKDSILRFVKEESDVCSEHSSFSDSEFILKLVIPTVEASYGKRGEMYSLPGYELLQREVELFKQRVLARPPKIRYESDLLQEA